MQLPRPVYLTLFCIALLTLFVLPVAAENPMGSMTVETTVTVESGLEMPVADFTWTPGDPVTGQPVTFTDQSLNNPTARYWWVNGTPLFSGVDGTGRPLRTFTSPELVYTFTTPGETNITMLAANEAGDSAPVTKIVTVGGPTIEPAFVTPPALTVKPGENITVPVVLSVVPNGFVGCGFTLRIEDAGLAEVVEVSFPPGIDGDFNGWNGAGYTGLPAPGVEVWPFMGLDPQYWTNVALGNVTIRGLANGTTRVRYSGYYNDGFYSDNIFVPVNYSTLTVGDVATPPVANFTANVTTGTAPLTVQFTDTSVGTPAGWAWTFGDGGTSAEQHPVHTFTAAGTYTVSLNATNDGGSDTSLQEGLIVVASAFEQLPGASNPPTDLNGDGKVEDVNGNARTDFGDVILYFNQMAWIAAHEPLAAFDFNGNGRIDFADVVWLFNHL